MLKIMAEVIRNNSREQLRDATSITIALDESKGQRIIRYRADAPTEPFIVDGVFGVVDSGATKVTDMTTDHADAFITTLRAFLKAWCTPLQGAFDADLLRHITNSVRVISSDGGSGERRKVFHMMKQVFPQAFLAIRDFAHAARIEQT